MDHYVKNPVPATRKSRQTRMSDKALYSLQKSEYVKEKQIFLYIRGINTTNYPALTKDLSKSLKELAFAKNELKQKADYLFQKMGLN